MSNEDVIDRLYRSLSQGDAGAAADCYGPGSRFSDPVFTNLTGAEAGAMWRMFIQRSSDLRVELLQHEAHGDAGRARWRASYTFSQTGRPVVNEIQATFRFAGGRIAEHHDDFDFYGWARQALGLPGLLLGWTPMIRSTVRKRARAQLDEFVAAEAKTA